jgi:hypothetical protein
MVSPDQEVERGILGFGFEREIKGEREMALTGKPYGIVLSMEREIGGTLAW